MYSDVHVFTTGLFTIAKKLCCTATLQSKVKQCDITIKPFVHTVKHESAIIILFVNMLHVYVNAIYNVYV